MATSEEFRTGPEVRTGFIKGNTFGYRAVQYYVIDDDGHDFRLVTRPPQNNSTQRWLVKPV